jgi:HD-GYP domain-containing protein (c-di-GMP phosphodiesterase class II)
MNEPSSIGVLSLYNPPPDAAVVADSAPGGWASRLNALAGWFGVEFCLVDGETGNLLVGAPSQPCGDWSLRGLLCSEAAKRCQPSFVEEADPIAVLAIPLPSDAGAPQVATAAFLTRPVAPDENLTAAGRLLGLDWEQTWQWIDAQSPIPHWAIERMAGMAQSLIRADAQNERLEEQMTSVTRHLSDNYEEISLLYRLTHNLRISARVEDLARLAIDWISDILPARGLAVQLIRPCEEGELPDSEIRSRTEWLTVGDCPLDEAQFQRLVDHLKFDIHGPPVVLNARWTSAPDWPFPEVQGLVLTPLSEGEHVFGWLAAFNHQSNEEFGTIEASLLSSVSAILGIHSGNLELYRRQARLLSGVIRALSSAIDAKDPYTCGHSDRVARVSVRLAQEMGLAPEVVNTIYLAGLLHDVGKIGINDQVLQKPGTLTPEEFDHIKTHTVIGHKILVGLDELGQVLPVVLHHHEAWDGSGYPLGLSGEAIPLFARIVAVADSFDAMGSDRPYRKGMQESKLDQILREGAGKQWDLQVVDAFFRARDDIRRIAERERDALRLDGVVGGLATAGPPRASPLG